MKQDGRRLENRTPRKIMNTALKLAVFKRRINTAKQQSFVNKIMNNQSFYSISDFFVRFTTLTE